MNGRNPAGARIYVLMLSAFAALWALVALGMLISGAGIAALVPFVVAMLIAGIAERRCGRSCCSSWTVADVG